MSIRRISVDRNAPLAVAPRRSRRARRRSGSSAPTVHGSRRAQPGYSTGGGGGGRLSVGRDFLDRAFVARRRRAARGRRLARCGRSASADRRAASLAPAAAAPPAGRAPAAPAPAAADAISSGLMRIAPGLRAPRPRSCGSAAAWARVDRKNSAPTSERRRRRSRHDNSGTWRRLLPSGEAAV